MAPPIKKVMWVYSEGDLSLACERIDAGNTSVPMYTVTLSRGDQKVALSRDESAALAKIILAKFPGESS